MSKTFERRMAVAGFEFREASDELTLTGYASVYDAPYSMGWYTETVKPGAFKRSLGTKPDVTLLVNHAGLPLARTTSGTLTLDGEDSHGLGVRASLDPSDPDVQAIAPKMRRGDLGDMSFSFAVMGADGDEWSRDMKQRTMHNLELNDGDVAVVTRGASRVTSSSIRSDEEPNLRDLSSALRTLESRSASNDDVANFLTRALPYFRGVENIGDLRAAAPVEPDGDEPCCGCCEGDCCDCTDPECDGTCCDACDAPARAAVALATQERRQRSVRLAR